jgi:hypothetical protein
MDENESVFPSFKQKFLGIRKAKIRGMDISGSAQYDKDILEQAA